MAITMASVLGILLLIYYTARLSAEKIPPIFDGCFKTKGCISSSENCITKKNCDILITYTLKTDYFEFELLAPVFGDSGFVALGLSKDRRMGNDLGVDCVIKKSVPEVWQSWNKNREHFRLESTKCSDQGTHKGLRNCTAMMQDGKIYCKFRRYRVIAHEIFGIGKSDILYKRFVFLAYGDNVFENNVGQHKINPFVTPTEVDFQKKKQNFLSERPKITSHVYLMIICWTFLVPNSMFVVRYLKETITRIVCCSRKLWFFIHVFMMTLGFFMCITAVCLVLWARSKTDSKWPTITASIRHAQIGGISAFAFAIQMASGWYRPLSQSSRKAYTLVHSAIGRVAYILACANLFQSYYVGMPCYVYLIILLVIIWHLTCHALMIYHFKWLDENLGIKKCRALSLTPIKVVLYEEAPGKKQRLCLTIINFVGSAIITTGLCLLYHFKHHTCVCKEDFCSVSN